MSERKYRSWCGWWVDQSCYKEFYNETDGPARVWEDGDKIWNILGKRTGGPGMIFSNGEKVFDGITQRPL